MRISDWSSDVCSSDLGTTSEIGPLSEELVDAVENHRFDPLAFVHWRSENLDFGNPQRLLKSLDARPPRPELQLLRNAEDQMEMEALENEPEIAQLVPSADSVVVRWGGGDWMNPM